MKSSILGQFQNPTLIDFKSSYVYHPHFKRVLKAFEKALCFSCSDEFESVAVSGATGVGKSTVCRAFEEKLQAMLPANSDEKPVINITAKTFTTAKGFYSSLLFELGAVNSTSGTTEDMRKRLVKLFHEKGVIMIILDEFQDLFECKSTQSALLTANFYKGFMKEMKIPVVISGTEVVAELLKINRQFQRLYNLYELPGFNMRSHQAIEYFSKFVAELMKNAPLPLAFEFKGVALKRLYLATEGSLALIKKLATEAIYVALENGQEELDLYAFAQAFKRYFIQRQEEIGLNPFEEDRIKVNRVFQKVAV
ncbi:TniB family NTP-binding protein [Photobacterium swingsii]|uniref:TniB family NTP-binding protein n=1 Tax=Photobacterium swingsii TaxID=680026 RepID=UPI003553EBE5